MFNRCGMQFGFRYVQGLRRPPSAFMICGTATDKAVNWDLDTKIISGELASLKDIQDLAAEAVDSDNRRDAIELDPEDKAIGKSVPQVLGETKDKAVRLVTIHHSRIAPLIQPWRTSRRFTVNLDGFLRARATLLHREADSSELSPWRRRVMTRQAESLNAAAKEGIDFVGEQDIVEKYETDDHRYKYHEGESPKEILNVRDTKTSAKRKNQGDADSDDQLTAYAMASMVVDDQLPNNLMFDVLTDTPVKKLTSAETFTTKRTSLDVDIYLNRIANAVGAIQQGIFTPTQQTNWWCSEKYCGYAKICPYFRATRRPGSELFTGLENAGKADDLLPILQKSVALARKDDEDDADF